MIPVTITFIICVFALLISAVIASHKYPRTPRHSCTIAHAPVIIGAQPAATELPGTVILYRCRNCAIRFTATISGQWEVQDVIREKDEISDLHGMYTAGAQK